jgi:hypothetical protein
MKLVIAIKQQQHDKFERFAQWNFTIISADRLEYLWPLLTHSQLTQ